MTSDSSLCDCSHNFPRCSREFAREYFNNIADKFRALWQLKCCKCGKLVERPSFLLSVGMRASASLDDKDHGDDSFEGSDSASTGAGGCLEEEHGMTAIASTRSVRHRACKLVHPDHLPCPLCNTILDPQAYTHALFLTNLVLSGQHLQFPAPSAHLNLLPDLHNQVTVLACRMPHIGPKRTEQRYRQKSLVADNRLVAAIHRPLLTAQCLFLLLRDGWDFTPSFLRAILNVLFSQFADLIHNVYPAVDGNIWPRESTFAAEHRLAGVFVQESYDGVWNALWRFGIMNGDFPRMCSMEGSHVLRESWAGMVELSLLPDGLWLVLKWTAEDLVEGLRHGWR